MFFDSSSFGHPTVTMSAVKGWASAICDQHLNAGADPTESLTKVAEANGLTTPQIEVLAGEINKTIHTAKYASAEDKYHAADFPLADAKAAIQALQAPTHTEKIAVEMPDPKVNTDLDLYAAFGIEPEMLEKQASETGAQVSRGWFRKTAADLEKAQTLKRMVDDEYTLAKHACDNSELDYIKLVRQSALTGMNSADRLTKIGEAIHAARCAGLLEEARKPLAKVALSLAEEGLISSDKSKGVVEYLLKHADEKAPDYLISDWMKAKVVNGSHPLVIRLKTFCDNAKEVSEQLARRNVCDDQVRIFSQKLRAL